MSKTLEHSEGLAATAHVISSLSKGRDHPVEELENFDLPGAEELRELGYSKVGLDLLKALNKRHVFHLPVQGSIDLLQGESLYLSGAV